MSQSQTRSTSQGDVKHIGSCSVCLKVLHLNLKDGKVRRHCSTDGRCSGSNQLPLSVTTPHSSQPLINGSNDLSHLPLSSSQVPASSQTTRTWNHPVLPCGTVKHIPKSARAACAVYMIDKIRNIERNVDNEEAWYTLLTMGEMVLL